MDVVLVEPSEFGTTAHGGVAVAVPGILVTVIFAVPATPNWVDVSRIRVMIEASQVTTGVTPVPLGAQYCALIGIVKIFAESIGKPVV